MTPQIILENAFKSTGIYQLNEEVADNNKYVYPSNVKIPSQRRNWINTSNEKLTTNENRLLIAEKTYSKKYTNINQIPLFSDMTIISYCKDTRNLSAGFALSYKHNHYLSKINILENIQICIKMFLVFHAFLDQNTMISFENIFYFHTDIIKKTNITNYQKICW